MPVHGKEIVSRKTRPGADLTASRRPGSQRGFPRASAAGSLGEAR